MSTSKLMKVTYYDPKSQIRLLCYADTVVWDTKPTPTLTALRFGGSPERVQGLADAIYGGATIEIEDGKDTYSLKTLTRQYRRELSHDGVYAEATLIAEDDGQSAKQNAGDKDEPDKDKNDEDDDQIQQDLPPRNTYIFCTPGERRELFDAVDQKTAVPMIPEYQDYVLTELQKRNKQCKGQIELLLPARSLKVLASLSNDSDVYEMGVTGKSLVFWSGTLLFSARLVEGKFPNTSGIFEQFKCQYSVHLDAAEFIRALEVAESVSESNHRVELTFGEHEITVSAESACGRSSAPVKALVLNAPKQPFYYNSRKLLEYLRLEKEKITLEFDKFGLLVVRSGSTRYVQSPMRAPVQAAETGKAA